LAERERLGIGQATSAGCAVPAGRLPGMDAFCIVPPSHVSWADIRIWGGRALFLPNPGKRTLLLTACLCMFRLFQRLARGTVNSVIEGYIRYPRYFRTKKIEHIEHLEQSAKNNGLRRSASLEHAATNPEHRFGLSTYNCQRVLLPSSRNKLSAGTGLAGTGRAPIALPHDRLFDSLAAPWLPRLSLEPHLLGALPS
jgi:hypothetical protein